MAIDSSFIDLDYSINDIDILDIVKYKINNGAKVTEYNNNLIKKLILNTKHITLHYVISLGIIDLSFDNNTLLMNAVMVDNYKITNMLLSQKDVDPRQDNSHALLVAISNRSIMSLKLLINDGRVLPSDANDKALKIATNDIDLEIIDMLIIYDKNSYNETTIDKMTSRLNQETLIALIKKHIISLNFIKAMLKHCIYFQNKELVLNNRALAFINSLSDLINKCDTNKEVLMLYINEINKVPNETSKYELLRLVKKSNELHI